MQYIVSHLKRKFQDFLTANVNWKTVDLTGIWTRTFRDTDLSLYQLTYRVTGNGVLI